MCKLSGGFVALGVSSKDVRKTRWLHLGMTGTVAHNKICCLMMGFCWHWFLFYIWRDLGPNTSQRFVPAGYGWLGTKLDAALLHPWGYHDLRLAAETLWLLGHASWD